MAFTKMVSMAKTPQEVNEEVKRMTAPVSAVAADVNEYPYGLCISLCDEELKKLDIDEMPEVGDTIHLQAFAKVTSVSMRENAGGSDRRIELQITDIACEDENKEALSSEDRAKNRYGNDEDEE